MNNFSFNRLSLFAKSEIGSNRKQMLLFAGISVAVFMVINYFNYIASGETVEFSGAVVASWMFICGSVAINTSRAFQKYYHKGYASAALMLPVSQSEKFTFALVYNMLFVPFFLIVVGYAISLIWSMGCDAENIFFGFREEIVITVFSALSTLSFFFFGAVFFRRNQFGMTLLALTCIGAAIVYGVYLMVTIFDLYDLPHWMASLDIDEIYWKYIQIGWNAVMLSAMCLLAWCRFRKLQITK